MANSSDKSKTIEVLSRFTMLNEEDYDFSVIDIADEDYTIQVDNKKYPFKILSDMDSLISFDKDALKTRKRHVYAIYRNLRLMFTLPIVFPKLVVGYNQDRILKNLILYNKNNANLVIDYYELFGFEKLNLIDKVDIYYLYVLIK